MARHLLLAVIWLLSAPPVSAQQLENLERALRNQQDPDDRQTPSPAGKREIRQPGYLGALGDETPAGLGVEIVQVFRDGPADRAGLEPGDVIIAIDEQPVHTLADMAALVTGAFAGQNLRVQISRKGQEATLPIVLGLRPAPQNRVPPPPPLPDDARLPALPEQPVQPENLEAKVQLLEAKIRYLTRRLEALERALELAIQQPDASRSELKAANPRESKPATAQER